MFPTGRGPSRALIVLTTSLTSDDFLDFESTIVQFNKSFVRLLISLETNLNAVDYYEGPEQEVQWYLQESIEWRVGYPETVVPVGARM